MEQLTDQELLKAAGPSIRREEFRNPIVRMLLKRIRFHLKAGKTPDETAAEFGLGSAEALRYWLDQIGVEIQGRRVWSIAKKKSAA